MSQPIGIITCKCGNKYSLYFNSLSAPDYMSECSECGNLNKCSIVFDPITDGWDDFLERHSIKPIRKEDIGKFFSEMKESKNKKSGK